jgi:hypothetical protein
VARGRADCPAGDRRVLLAIRRGRTRPADRDGDRQGRRLPADATGPTREEFHNAITDLLSGWGSTVPDPEVVTLKIVAPLDDGVALAIRDFLDRMGMPSEIYEPESDVGRLIRDQHPEQVGYPLVHTINRPAIVATSVRDVAMTLYGAPRDWTWTTSWTSRSSEAGPRGWQRRCTPQAKV